MIATHNPINAIMMKDMRRLDAPATMPIRGGPIKNPKKPMLDTAASATPGDISLDFPAVLYTSGTTEDTPSPTRKNPVMAGARYGNTNEMPSPVTISSPLSWMVLLNPSFIVTQSPIKRPAAMVHMNAV